MLEVAEMPLAMLRICKHYQRMEISIHDLLSDKLYEWRGEWNFVELNPDISPAHIFRLIDVTRL